jgi:polyferredoxin
MKDLEKRIDNIEKRNKRVELDKSWETSWTRRICIMILTYIVVLIYSYVISKYNNIFFSSLVPVIGFTLSTLSLRLVRKLWEKKRSN